MFKMQIYGNPYTRVLFLFSKKVLRLKPRKAVRVRS